VHSGNSHYDSVQYRESCAITATAANMNMSRTIKELDFRTHVSKVVSIIFGYEKSK